MSTARHGFDSYQPHPSLAEATCTDGSRVRLVFHTDVRVRDHDA
ncbi:hypothetical protein ACFQ60_02715 [Streptomyces zhihengii]|nr:hypothetical protein [Streptomyces zhihengii]